MAGDCLLRQHFQLDAVEPIGNEREAALASDNAFGPDHRSDPTAEHRDVAVGIGGEAIWPHGIDQAVGTHSRAAGERQHLQDAPRLPALQASNIGAIERELV